MRRLRFHLGTYVVLCVVLRGIAGLNLTVRTREQVDYVSAKKILQRPQLLRMDFTNFGYRVRLGAAGWPFQMTSDEIYFLTDIHSADDSAASETQMAELRQLLENEGSGNFLRERWDATRFQQLAPSIYAGLILIDPISDPRFLKDKKPANLLALIHWEPWTVAMNVGVALVLTLVVAAGCEVWLRRRKDVCAARAL